MTDRHPFCIMAATLLLLTAAAAPAQEPTPEAVVSESVQVNVINVDVAVVDRAGRPVSGLTAADFELEEDGTLAPLTNFFAWDSTDAIPTPTAAPVTTAPVAAAPTATVASDQALHLVVLIDNAHISYAGRKSVFNSLAAALSRSLGPGDKVMLVSYGQSFREVRAFTADRSDIAAALAKLARQTAEGTITHTQWNRLLRQISGTEHELPGTPSQDTSTHPANEIIVMQERILFDIQAFAEEQYAATHAMMKILTNFVDSLAGLPGRKAVLWVSEGISRLPAAELMEEWQLNFPDAARDLKFNAAVEAEHYSLSQDFLELTRRANSGRVMLYTVDAAADRGPEGRTIEDNTLTGLVGLAGSEALNRKRVLTDFATATGGTAVVNSAHLDSSLEALVKDSRAGYSLGFQPAHFGDGKYHRLKVRVKRDGLLVRYREGYLDKSAGQRLADRTGAALLEDGGENPLEVQVFAGDSTRRGDDSFLVPLTLRIPAQNVVLKPVFSGAEARLSVCFMVKDANGRSSEAQPRTVPLSVTTEAMATFQRYGAAITFQLMMHKGQQRVGVTVRDELSLVQSSVVLKLRVPTEG
jgi:VWFA-related protein